MIIRELKKEDVEKEPFQIWNAFINLIATETYENLNEIQRIAHLAFWYDSEINNGGHLQYFENQGTDHLTEVINALKNLKAFSQAKILERAAKQFSSKERNMIKSIFMFVQQARDGEYDELDNEYYECTPSIDDLLNDYLEKNREQFIKCAKNARHRGGR